MRFIPKHSKGNNARVLSQVKVDNAPALSEAKRGMSALSEIEGEICPCPERSQRGNMPLP